jgi:hypothetical protein
MSAKSMQEKPVQASEAHKIDPSSDESPLANGILPPQDDNKLEIIQKKIQELKIQLRQERHKRAKKLIERHTLTLPLALMNHLRYTAIEKKMTLGEIIQPAIRNELLRLGIAEPPAGKKLKLRVGRRKVT